MFSDTEAELQAAEANDAAVMKTSRAFPTTATSSSSRTKITSTDTVTQAIHLNTAASNQITCKYQVAHKNEEIHTSYETQQSDSIRNDQPVSLQ